MQCVSVVAHCQVNRGWSALPPICRSSCSVISSAAICWHRCNLSARLQLVRATGSFKLSSTADCQFGCNDQVRPVSPAAHIQPRCNFQLCLLRCSLSAQLHTVTFVATSKLCPAIYRSSCVTSAHLQSVCSHVSCHTVYLH